MLYIYTPVVTPRIRYITGLIFRDHLRFPYRLTPDLEAWTRADGAKINYSPDIYPGALRIPPSGILDEAFTAGLDEVSAPAGDPMEGVEAWLRAGGVPGALGKAAHSVETSIAEEARSATAGGADSTWGAPDSWPFDLFGAAFYLLSRYEEYLPGAIFDPMGRFDPAGSWAYRHGCLERPLLDEWFQALGARLQSQGQIPGQAETPRQAPRQSSGMPSAQGMAPGFTFCPTYDIDIPWCYRHKGRLRTLGGIARDLLKGRWARLSERRKVLTGRLPDPFENYAWMDQANLDQPWQPTYFFPVASRRGPYDKNPSPDKGVYKELIRRHDALYPVGIHPSFLSTTEPGMLQEELQTLASILDRPVNLNRFHYIRFRLPRDYRLLLEYGITMDYSMGYGEVNGFRASYSRPFRWYDLAWEEETTLTVVPYCYMEASANQRWRNRREDVRAEMDYYLRTLRAVNGQMTVIWHNNTLGREPHWTDWRDLYGELLQKVKIAAP